MALSYCPSQAAFHHLYPEMTTFQHCNPSEEICFCDYCVIQNATSDPFFNPDDFLYAENDPHTLPFHFPTNPPLHFPPEVSPAEEHECCCCPKRIRNCDDFSSPFLSARPFPDLSSDFMLLPSELQIPATGFLGGSVSSLNRSNAPSSLSAQSIAARQRRKKISEKTQELGKLIPGGNKMNTAEMLQAAFKYVKLLQAQVGILELMGSIQECKEAPCLEGLHVLVSSLRVQEKLYEEEKCIIPQRLVEALAKDQDLQSRTSISKEIHFFIQSMTYNH